MTAIPKLLARLRDQGVMGSERPVDQALLHAAGGEIGPFPEDLAAFYMCSNGAHFATIRILPLEDPAQLRKTWDGLRRANDPTSSKFVRDEGFLLRFLIFAELGGSDFAAVERSTGRIWYSSAGELSETTLTVAAFLEGAAHAHE